MSQALQVPSNVAADLAAAAERIKALMRSVATTTIELGVELKRVRDAHFPIVMVPRKGVKGGQKPTHPGWSEWLATNFKFTPDRARQLIRVADQYGKKVNTRALTGTVLEQMLQVAGQDAVEQEIIDANDEAIRRTGKGLTQRKARTIVAKHRKKAKGVDVDRPQLPSPREAKAIAVAQREKGNIVLIPARDGQFYTGADEADVQAHEAARDLALMVEYAIDTLAKVEATPHEYMSQTPVWLRWWLTKEGNISTKGKKVGEVARWLTAFAAAVEHGR